MILKHFLPILVLLFLYSESWAIDASFEGRVIAESFYIFDSPKGFDDFDSDAELRLGITGNAWKKEGLSLDYEISGDVDYVNGPRVQVGLADDFDADFFRAWLRLDTGNFQLRGGRQKILFGAGALFRPLGFFDTRDISGIVPETEGVDGFRLTYFFDETTSIQGWTVPGKRDDHVIVGGRWEGLIKEIETGVVVQYHPITDLDDLPQFDQELIQLGFHLKGERTVGYWNESRLDIEQKNGNHPLRFDSVFGVDYTFPIGGGLHVLGEYFLSTSEEGFTLLELQGDDRTFHELGFLIDQPVGIAVVWRVFGFYDFLDGSFQIVPQIEYAATDQVYIYLTGRIGEDIIGGDRDGRLFRNLPVFTGTESNVGLAVVVYF